MDRIGNTLSALTGFEYNRSEDNPCINSLILVIDNFNHNSGRFNSYVGSGTIFRVPATKYHDLMHMLVTKPRNFRYWSAPCSTGTGYSTSTVRWLSWYCPTFLRRSIVFHFSVSLCYVRLMFPVSLTRCFSCFAELEYKGVVTDLQCFSFWVLLYRFTQ